MRPRALLALVGLALAGCGADTTVTPEAAPAEPTTTPTYAPAPTVTRPPATTPTTAAAVAEGPLGTTFTVSPGDRKITAYTLKMPVASENQFTKPKAGMVYAAAEVQECAGPAGERFSPNRFDFELALTDNTRVEAGIEVAQPQLASSPLLPGDCIRGWVSFEVPAAGTVRHVVYSKGNGSAKWRAA